MKLLFYSIIIKALCLIIFPLAAMKAVSWEEADSRSRWEVTILSNSSEGTLSEEKKEIIQYALMQLSMIGRGKHETLQFLFGFCIVLGGLSLMDAIWIYKKKEAKGLGHK
jgi:hypothetical protein